jgi:hypothetical protein
MERFAAPLSEFHKRRIVFWYDEDGEFAEAVDELALSGVNACDTEQQEQPRRQETACSGRTACRASNMRKTMKLGRTYKTPLQLHIDIMAVLCNLAGGSAQDVTIAVLSAGLEGEN